MSDGYRHVPMLPELHQRGLAVVAGRTDKREPTHYRATAQGQAEIDDAMRHNAAWAREHPAESIEMFNEAVRVAKAAPPKTKKK